MLPQFDLWCQFCSVIACDPQYEVGGTKWVCSSALVHPFPVDFTHSSLIDNAFYPANKQNLQNSELQCVDLFTMNSKEASNVHIYKERNILHWSRTSI